jgi:hypothetical protein
VDPESYHDEGAKLNDAFAKAVELELQLLNSLNDEQRALYHEMEALWFGAEADLREDLGYKRGN